jgi:alkylhydroperoxidase family enzyme
MPEVTPRILPLRPPYDPAVAAEFARIEARGLKPIKLFRTIAHNPRVLQRFFAGSLLDRGSIDLREREIVILRTSARCGSEYEWGVHVQHFAARAGLDPAEVRATVLGGADDGAWRSRDRLLIALVDRLHETGDIDDALAASLAEFWTPAQILELTALIGFYHLVAFITGVTKVEREDGAPRFPIGE